MKNFQVICINSKHSTKLIKGAVYDVDALHTNNLDRYIHLCNLGSYNIKKFTQTDGQSFDNIKDFSVNNNYLERIKPGEKDYTGQFVKCFCDTGKSLKKDQFYFVESQKSTTHTSYNGTTWYEYKIKIRGIRNLISSDRFIEIPLIEQRNIKLKNLEGTPIKTGEKTRKFLHYDEKKKTAILIDAINKVLIDINNTANYDKVNINFIEMILIKGKNYNIIENEVIEFLNSNIGSLIKCYL